MASLPPTTRRGGEARHRSWRPHLGQLLLGPRRPARLVTISFPRYDSGTNKHYGPARYSVTNHAGKVEAQGVIAIDAAGSTAATTAFIDERDGDPITAVDTGSSFGSVAQLRVTLYDLTGTQADEERAYFSIPSSLPGTDGTHLGVEYSLRPRNETSSHKWSLAEGVRVAPFPPGGF
jgi:hypothetical protein